MLKNLLGPFEITEVHQGGRFDRLSTGHAAHYEIIKPHNASSEDWCIPADMHEVDYLIVDPACEVNERGTRDKNDGNEVMHDCDLPLDLDLTERIEVNDETLPNVEDWKRPEQTEIDIGVEPDFSLTMETRQSKRGSDKRKYKPYGEDFVVVRIVMDDVTDSIVVFDEIMIPQDIDLVDDTEADRIDNWSEPEMLKRNNEHELTNLRVLQWLHDLTADLKETILTSQDIYQTSFNYISHDNTVSNWITPDGPLCVPESNLDLLDPGQSKKTSIDIFVRGLVVGLTHTKKHKSKKLKSARKTGELETDGENFTKPPFGRIF